MGPYARARLSSWTTTLPCGSRNRTLTAFKGGKICPLQSVILPVWPDRREGPVFALFVCGRISRGANRDSGCFLSRRADIDSDRGTFRIIRRLGHSCFQCRSRRILSDAVFGCGAVDTTVSSTH